MGFNSKNEMLENFLEKITKSIPEYQPDGKKSEPLLERLYVTAREGSVRFETIIHISDHTKSLDVEFQKIPYGNSFAIVGFVYDMTSIREREMELARIKENDELQLTKLNAVVTATKIGLWDITINNNDPVNPDNVFTWSDEFRYMLGYSSIEDFPNSMESWSDKLHPDEKETVFKAVYDHISDKTGNTPYDVEYRLLCKSGEYLYFRVCGESIRDKDGNVNRVAGAIMDITEEKKILFSTQKQRIDAEEANKAKSTFLSNMSHEIRTPLNAIIGMTTIGKMAEDIAKKDNAFFKIEGASKHLLGVINDVLDMSKIEANKLQLSPVNFNFDGMLQKSMDIVNPRIEDRRQKLIVNTAENIPPVLIGDDQRLVQVITNLLSNAAKFTPEEGNITIISRLVSEEDDMCRIEVCVCDTGIGITDEQKSRLFDSFEQADARTARNFGGTGLGLPISKRIVELMEGKIWIESQPGKGSKFFFDVLLKRGDSSEYSNGADNNNKNDFADFTGKTVLLTEDVEINREIVMTLLEPTNLTIECAENGTAAVRMFTEAPDKYDLIFMDIQMPEMDGYEATQTIRSFEKEQSMANPKWVPIIAMTANVFREDVERCLEAGMNDHLKKPIDLNSLINILKKYLG